jgi:hypothetical protein
MASQFRVVDSQQENCEHTSAKSRREHGKSSGNLGTYLGFERFRTFSSFSLHDMTETAGLIPVRFSDISRWLMHSEESGENLVETLLDRPTAAAYLCISVRTLDRNCKSGALKWIKISGCVRFRIADLVEFVCAHTMGGSGA